MRKVVIVTGGSKGIGSSICLKYLDLGYLVYSISRSRNTNIINDNFIEFELDLLKDEITMVCSVFKNILNLNKQVKEILLFNNAGTLGDVKEVGQLSYSNIQNTYRLNTIIPIALTNLFIEETKGLKCIKEVINISSGAAANPIEGWSIYGSSKAAIDMFTKVVGKEQKDKEFPVHVVSIYPGKVDTEMQNEIRNTSIDNFKNVNHFIEFKNKGMLVTPDSVANKIIEVLNNKSIKNGDIVRL